MPWIKNNTIVEHDFITRMILKMFTDSWTYLYNQSSVQSIDIRSMVGMSKRKQMYVYNKCDTIKMTNIEA